MSGYALNSVLIEGVVGGHWRTPETDQGITLSLWTQSKTHLTGIVRTSGRMAERLTELLDQPSQGRVVEVRVVGRPASTPDYLVLGLLVVPVIIAEHIEIRNSEKTSDEHLHDEQAIEGGR